MLKRVLFSTACGPYPTFAFNDSTTDGNAQRFTKGQDIFTSSGHIHCHAVHILSQNISWPTVVLEYPRFDDFEKEVRKGYEYVGISFFPSQLDIITKMCRLVRRVSPESKICLGSFGVMAFAEAFSEEEQKNLADHICFGEGVRFMRRLLGDPVDAPIKQRLLPKCSSTLPWLDKDPPGEAGFLITGLGCPGGCDFCSTTALYGGRRIELASPQQTFEEMKRCQRVNENVKFILLIEEDHFREKEHLKELGRLIREDTELGLENISFYTFGSISSISEWEPDDIALTGVGIVFIGLESKFAPEHGYYKRRGDAREVFRMLHSIGVSTVGAWMCGWDFHDRQNIYEDLDYFISCEPTFNQLARVCPFPGTALYDRLREEGRLGDVPWEDVHFYGGGYRHTNFEDYELMRIIDDGYRKLYETWGSSIVRQFNVALNGYEYCQNSKHRILRERKAERHETVCKRMYPLLKANEWFAPNGFVRRRIIKMQERYYNLFGEPTTGQKVLENYILYKALREKIRNTVNPRNRKPRQEPCKIYTYDKDKPLEGDEKPYKVYHPHFDLGYHLYNTRKKAQAFVLGNMVRLLGSEERVASAATGRGRSI